MHRMALGRSALQVRRIGRGTTTFGDQLATDLAAWDTRLAPEMLEAIEAIVGNSATRRSEPRATESMAKKPAHVSQTPATQWLERQGVAYTEHVYDYVEHGGTAESSRQIGVPEHEVIKTLVMQDEQARPLIVLMHGDRQVSTKNLAREIGAKRIDACRPEVAQRHSGYLVGGTSPFGTRRPMPVYIEASVLELPRALVNGGRRGFLVGIDPRVFIELLDARPVRCAL